MTKKGLIVTRKLRQGELQSARVVIRFNPTTNQMEKGTLTHINADGNYNFESSKYNGSIPDNEILATIEVTDIGSIMVIGVDPGQWNKLIRLNVINKQVLMDYNPKPIPFHYGPYHNTCFNCQSDFEGYKRQTLCEVCCNTLGTAHIVIPVPQKLKKTKSNGSNSSKNT